MIRLAKGRIRPGVRDIQYQPPLSFLYPSIGGSYGSLSSFESSTNEKTPFASTSYSTLQPSKRVNAEEAVPYRREISDSLEATIQYRKKNKDASNNFNKASPIDNHFNSASYIGTAQTERQKGENNQFRGGDEGDRKGKRPEIHFEKSRIQDVLLGRTFVRDIMQQPLNSDFTVNEIELLEEVSETYLQYAEEEVDLLDKLMPELALAFMHIGQDERALTLLKRTSRLCANSKAYTSTPLQSWKKVLATAFTRGKYELTANFVKAASGGLNEEDDWAMLARFEALLMIRWYNRTESAETDSIDVDQYWKEYEVHKRQAPEIVFSTLLKEQVKAGKVDAIRQTLIARQQHGHTIEDETWRVLLDLHPRGRRKGFLGELIADLNVDGQKAFADVISSLTSENDIRRVWLAFRMFGVSKDLRGKSSGWIPSFDTIEALINLFAFRTTPDAAIKVLQLALDLDIQGDYTVSYLKISQSLRKFDRPEDALVFASHMVGICLQNQNRPHRLTFHLPKPIVSPSKRCFRECLLACSTLDNPIDVVERSREVLLDSITFRDSTLKVRAGVIAVFRAIMTNARLGEMSSFLDELSKQALQRSQKDGDGTLSLFIDALNSEGAIDEVIVAKRERVSTSSRDARENLEWVTKSHETSNLLGVYTNTAIESEENGGHLTPEKRAALLLEAGEMSADPHVHLTPRLTSMAYALRLRVFAVVRQDYGSAVIIYRYMLARGIKPDVHHIAPILEGLVMSDRLEDARAIRDGARETLSGVDSSLRISAAIIRGHLHRNDWTGVQEELMEMRKRRVHPDSFILSMVRIAQSHYKRSKFQNLEKVNESNENAQKSMEPLWKDVQKKMHQEIREEFESNVNSGNSGQSTISATTRLTKKPVSAQKATKFYQNLYQSNKDLLAVQYLSNALRAGTIPHDRLRLAIRSHGRFMQKQLVKIGMDIQHLLEHDGPVDRFPYEKVEPEDETEEARLRNISITLSRERLANNWGPIVKLWNENRKSASGASPAIIERKRDEMKARQELLRLILDLYGSDRLREEAKERMLKNDEFSESISQD